MQPGIIVTDNPEAGRYEGRLDGELVGYCDYSREGSSLVLPHTETLLAYRGRGVADKIVGFALADAAKQGLKVVAQCSFVEQFIRANP